MSICLDDNTVTAELQEILQNNLEKLSEKVRYKDSHFFQYKAGMTESQTEYFKNCGHFIVVNDELKIVHANFCKNRMCPVCNKRYSAKKWITIKTIVDKLNSRKDYKWLFFTVTVRNCPAEELSKTISEIMKALNRMNANKRWKRTVLGFFRSLEVTFNSEKNSYHPHVHILLCVPPDYFINTDYYISSYDWRRMWEKAARTDYYTFTDVRPIKDAQISNAVAEVAKYAVKLSSVAEQSTKALKVISDAIKGRRLIAYGGIIKTEYKAFKEDYIIPDDTNSVSLMWDDNEYKVYNQENVNDKGG